MKKILIGIVIVLLGIIAYTTIMNGYSVFKLNILSFENIKAENVKLDDEILQAEKIKTQTYPSKMSDLSKAAKDLIAEKQKYEEDITYTSEEDIKKANELRKYKVELLWTKIGTYATKNGVTLNFSITNSSAGTPNMNDLSFDITGNYISITDFVSDLENDATLSFSIDDFKLIPASTSNKTTTGKNLEATFVVRDVPVDIDINSSSSLTSATNVDTSATNTSNTTKTTTNGQNISNQ